MARKPPRQNAIRDFVKEVHKAGREPVVVIATLPDGTIRTEMRATDRLSPPFPSNQIRKRTSGTTTSEIAALRARVHRPSWPVEVLFAAKGATQGRRCRGCPGRRNSWKSIPRRSSAPTGAACARPPTCASRLSASSPGSTGTASWSRIGPPSSASSTRWTVTPVTVTPWPAAVRHGVGAGECRQERRMDVDESARRTRPGPSARRSACTGEHDDVRLDGGESLLERGVVTARDQRCLEPLFGRPVKRRTSPVREDEDDRAAKAWTTPALAGRRQCPQVRARSRDADRDPGGVNRRRRRRHVARPVESGRVHHLAIDSAAGIPCASNTSIPTATAAGGSTTVIPSPPLNVARSSSLSNPPKAPNRRITDGIVQSVGSSRAARASGRAPGGTFPGRPPR